MSYEIPDIPAYEESPETRTPILEQMTKPVRDGVQWLFADRHRSYVAPAETAQPAQAVDPMKPFMPSEGHSTAA